MLNPRLKVVLIAAALVAGAVFLVADYKSDDGLMGRWGIKPER